MGYEYLRNESIIRSKTREFFGVGTVVTASTYLVSVVDFMLIGVLLGADAVAAAGLCDSFVDVADYSASSSPPAGRSPRASCWASEGSVRPTGSSPCPFF